jgi:CRISPR-associated endonuclease/helicase Cas3
MKNEEYVMPEMIAHYREVDGEKQYVHLHLTNVSNLAGGLAGKIGLARAGQLLGLLHDLGKYSSAFQAYIQSATELLDPDRDDEWVDAASLKGKIDHSTAGAQWIWQQFCRYGEQGKLVGQILAVCLASHHGGMLDCLQPDGVNSFLKRVGKEDDQSHLQECLTLCDEEIVEKLKTFASADFLKEFLAIIVVIVAPQKNEHDRLKHFRLGFLARFLFSCLVDADRIDSADFENPPNNQARRHGPVDWKPAIDRLEKKFSSLNVRNEVDEIRNIISQQCLQRANDPQGLYTLTVPTGGGKTFASIRYGLHHAKKYGLDRIIYIIPYTSIIEQNAQVVREILEEEGDEFPWVLEHHSNLEPETQTWHAKLSAENWDAPIIFTTMVQFLEVLFGGGTRGARRLHNLARSVIIFDEIQSLPVKCVHLFCNGLQFLVDHAHSTAILCTATQPLLNGVNPEYGALPLSEESEIVHDAAALFRDLQRVTIENLIKPGGWNEGEIAELALAQVRDKGNCLVIVNTKEWARKLFCRCQASLEDDAIAHLSTSLCPVHRKEILGRVNERLGAGLPVLCISTQLIEAGVDVDFNSVIRFLAGLDSIAQAAGRCNRNGNLEMAHVYVVNPQEEAISMLEDIRIGRDNAQRVLGEDGHDDFLSPSVMARYFSYYFYERAKQMTYPLTEKQAGRPHDTLVNLLSNNPHNVGRTKQWQLRQSFKTAGQAFAAIEAPTRAVIVPWGEGEKIIARLCADFAPDKAFGLLRKAQKYSVNLFPNVWDKLMEASAIHAIQEGEDIYYLDKRYYSPCFGVSTDVVAAMDTLTV